jgi:hypothetical protein
MHTSWSSIKYHKLCLSLSPKQLGPKMHFQSPPFWWLMTTTICFYKRCVYSINWKWNPPKCVLGLLRRPQMPNTHLKDFSLSICIHKCKGVIYKLWCIRHDKQTNKMRNNKHQASQVDRRRSTLAQLGLTNLKSSRFFTSHHTTQISLYMSTNLGLIYR